MTKSLIKSYGGDDLDRLKAQMREVTGKAAKTPKELDEPKTSIAKVEQDRTRKNSRTKGNSYELRIAKLFAEWSGEEVRRTPGSGGWSSSKFGVTGDLVCANKRFPFHVECKKREGWTLDDLITGVRKPDDANPWCSIEAWWRQCIESCPKGPVSVALTGGGLLKEPLLVFTRNRQADLVMVRHAFSAVVFAYPATDINHGARYLRVTLSRCRDGRGWWPTIDNTEDVIIMRLDEFLRLACVPKGCKNHKKERS